MLEATYRLAAPALALALGLAAQAHAASPLAVEAQHAMVVSAQHYASEVGVKILKEGGNAVDAAVAVGYALAVVDPCCGNIGGGGFMILHLADGRDSFINFRETAPAAARETMYLDATGKPVPGLSLYGYLAAGVPGTVMGLERARREYGRLPRAKVMAPAIELAREGYVLSRADTDILDNMVERFGKDPVARKIFLKPTARPSSRATVSSRRSSRRRSSSLPSAGPMPSTRAESPERSPRRARRMAAFSPPRTSPITP